MIQRRAIGLWVFALSVTVGMGALPCAAHPAQLVAAQAKIDPASHVRIRATFDLLAFVLNDTPARIDDASMNQLLDGPPDVLERNLENAKQRWLHGLVVRCGANRVSLDRATLRFPTVADVQRWRVSGITPRLPVIQEAVVEGVLPAGAKTIDFRFPDVLGSVVLTVERPGEEPFSEPVEPGDFSSTLPIRLASDLATSSAVPSPRLASDEQPAAWITAAKYLSLGFRHIVPEGLDHILFVLGLFLLSTHLKPLLWQVTAFTMAHSITLALAVYGLVRVPSMIVEPLIALSIAFVAVENLCTSELKPWRPLVVFGFGLIHGLGFAGALSHTGLSRHQFLPAVITFNMGVELGQLSVIALAFLVVGWWRRRTWYRHRIVFPASSAIAAVAIVWVIQRTLG